MSNEEVKTKQEGMKEVTLNKEKRTENKEVKFESTITKPYKTLAKYRGFISSREYFNPNARIAFEMTLEEFTNSKEGMYGGRIIGNVEIVIEKSGEEGTLYFTYKQPHDKSLGGGVRHRENFKEEFTSQLINLMDNTEWERKCKQNLKDDHASQVALKTATEGVSYTTSELLKSIVTLIRDKPFSGVTDRLIEKLTSEERTELEKINYICKQIQQNLANKPLE